MDLGILSSPTPSEHREESEVQGCQGHVLLDLECLHGWRLHTLCKLQCLITLIVKMQTLTQVLFHITRIIVTQSSAVLSFRHVYLEYFHSLSNCLLKSQFLWGLNFEIACSLHVSFITLKTLLLLTLWIIES